METVVKSSDGPDSGGVLRLALPKPAPKAVTYPLTLPALKPGTPVSCVVTGKLTNGITVSYLGCFSGAIPEAHLGIPEARSDWSERLRVGTSLTARVLSLSTSPGKSVLLTLAPHLLALSPPPLPPLGTTITNATVARVPPQHRKILCSTVPEIDGYDHARSIAEVDRHRPGTPGRWLETPNINASM